MATVNKDFKVKNGLIVEGTTGTINNYDILTKNPTDETYITNLVGGTGTSANTPDTLVKRDGSGNFAAGTITADLTGQVSDISNHDTDDLSEGATNQYFTDSRARQAISGFTGIDYNNTTGVISVDLGDFDTDDLVEGTSNKYFSNTLVDNHLSGGDGINYSAGTISADLGTGLNFSAGSIAVDRTTVDAWYDAAGDAQDVQDNLDTHTGASSGVHGVTGFVVGTTDSQTISNKTLGNDLAAGGYKVSGLADPTSNQDAATKFYVDDKIADLVDGAPALLDTLNELAAAINDDASFVTTITNSIGEKVAKAGDSMTGNLDFGGTNKVTSLAAPTSNGDAANKLYVDDAASTAQTNAENYTDSELTSYTPTASLDTTIDGYGYLKSADLAGYATESYADTAAGNAESNANGYTDSAINALDTDDIEEGTTNKYFTDNRAKDAAGYILENASQTNISITYDETNHTLSVTAENGVADSTTDDLDEGSTNLYFTNQRAIDALEVNTPGIGSAMPEFTEVTLNSVAKQVAAAAAVATASTVSAYTWAKADYRSAKFLVKFETSTHTEISEVLITLDGSDNVAITEYAVVGTNGNLGNVTADVSGSDVRLRVTTINNSTDVMVMGTLLV